MLCKPMPFTCKPRSCYDLSARVRFVSTSSASEQSLAVSSIATYIHSQINGSLPDIYSKLYDLVDVLEYPNDGSIAKVCLSDAIAMIEDIGAWPGELQYFMLED